MKRRILWLLVCMPVSYTHLDVYKRQTLHCKDGDRTLRTSFAAVEPLLCAYPCFCGICRGVVVNFHEVAGRQEDVFLLKDVYKRQ